MGSQAAFNCWRTFRGVCAWSPRPRDLCDRRDINSGVAGVKRGAQALASAAVVAGGEQARDPGLSPTSTRRTMPKLACGASALTPILDGSTAGELIPKLVRHGLQQLIELEIPDVLGAER